MKEKIALISNGRLRESRGFIYYIDYENAVHITTKTN
jgi:hypothetical protein